MRQNSEGEVWLRGLVLVVWLFRLFSYTGGGIEYDVLVPYHGCHRIHQLIPAWLAKNPPVGGLDGFFLAGSRQ